MSKQTVNGNKLVKNTLNKLIKNISYIAIFLAMGLIILLYAGPEITLNTKIVVKLAVPSVVLAISITTIYDLWVTNGQRSASSEPGYQELLELYSKKSDGLHHPTLQDFLNYESDRRYQVEYDKLTRIIEREQSILDKNLVRPKSFKLRMAIRRNKHVIAIHMKARNNIVIKMPYDKSEEFDYLRYNIQDVEYKEYAPMDTKKHLRGKRAAKYVKTFTSAVVGLNLISIGGTMGDIWTAIIMSVVAGVLLLLSVIGGFSTGYKNINIVSTGVYKTGNSFIDQAVAYCIRENKDLYYKGTTEFRETVKPEVEVQPIDNKPVETQDTDTVEIGNEIFTKLTNEVTEIQQ